MKAKFKKGDKAYTIHEEILVECEIKKITTGDRIISYTDIKTSRRPRYWIVENFSETEIKKSKIDPLPTPKYAFISFYVGEEKYEKWIELNYLVKDPTEFLETQIFLDLRIK